MRILSDASGRFQQTDIESRLGRIEARLDRFEADLAAHSTDRHWIVSVLASIAVDLEAQP